jgi:hypothetical protein
MPYIFTRSTHSLKAFFTAGLYALINMREHARACESRADASQTTRLPGINSNEEE